MKFHAKYEVLGMCTNTPMHTFKEEDDSTAIIAPDIDSHVEGVRKKLQLAFPEFVVKATWRKARTKKAP